MRRASITSKQRFRAFRESSRQGDEASRSERTSGTRIAPGRQRDRLRSCGAWLRPHRRTLLLIAALGLSSIAIDMLWPLASRYLVDHVILQPGLSLSFKLRRLALISA